MDAFLIEKFEKQGAERVQHYGDKDVWLAKFDALSLLIHAVAAVAWDLGVACQALDEYGPTHPMSREEEERLLEKARYDLGKLMVFPNGSGWSLS